MYFIQKRIKKKLNVFKKNCKHVKTPKHNSKFSIKMEGPDT